MKASMAMVIALTAVGGCAAAPTRHITAPESVQKTDLSPAASKPRLALPAAFTQKGVAVKLDSLWETPEGRILGVTGTAKNMTAVDLSFCQVALAFLDRDGAKLDDAKASTKSLKVGEVWRFQAALMHPSTAEYASITPEKLIAIPVGNAKPELASLK